MDNDLVSGLLKCELDDVKIDDFCLQNLLSAENIPLDRIYNVSTLKTINLNINTKYSICGVIGSDIRRKPNEIGVKKDEKYFMLSDLKTSTMAMLFTSSEVLRLWSTLNGKQNEQSLAVVVINPIITKTEIDNREGYKSEPRITLEITNMSQLVVIGKVADYGICQAVKKNGDNCRIPINLDETKYCCFHHNSTTSSIGNENISKSSENQYKHKVILHADQNQRLNVAILPNSLIALGKQHISKPIVDNNSNLVPKTSDILSFAASVHVNKLQQEHQQQQLLLKLQQSQKNSTSLPISNSLTISSSSLIPQRLTSKIGSLSTNSLIKKPIIHNNIPMIDNIKMVGNVLIDVKQLNQNALNYNKSQQNSRKRPISSVTLNSNNMKKQQEMDEIEFLLSKKSSHANEVKIEESIKEDKYIDGLIVKESIALKISTIHSINIIGYHCNDCNKHTEYMIPLCQNNKHKIINIKLIKRFYQCQNCYRKDNVLITFDNMKGEGLTLPKRRCECGQYNWVSCGKNGNVISSNKDNTRLVLSLSDHTSGQDLNCINTRISALEK